MTRVTDAMVEAAARVIWRADNPVEEGFSVVAPNDWDRWPRNGRQASLAQVRFCQSDYLDIARATLEAALAVETQQLPRRSHDQHGRPIDAAQVIDTNSFRVIP